VEWRVDELASRAGVSVDTVRFYQARGLLDPPRRQGRVALYSRLHLDRIAQVRALQAKGLTLAAIRRVVTGELDEVDEALVAAVAAGGARGGPEELFGLDELAARSGIPLPLLQAIEKEGLLVPRVVDGERQWSAADAEIARQGLRLLEAGLPLPEVLGLARRHHEAMRAVAEEAVALFDAHVREPLRTAGLAPDDAADRLVEAFHTLLPATTALVSHHFRRILLTVAQEHIESVGDDAERAAVSVEAGRLP
jgi:DNA-binding transcriptional MerR regulator